MSDISDTCRSAAHDATSRLFTLDTQMLQTDAFDYAPAALTKCSAKSMRYELPVF
jgi:hypothetical protein